MAPEEAPPLGRRLPLEVEDLLLAAWVAGGSMALRRWAGPWLGFAPARSDPSGTGLIVLGVAWAFLLVMAVLSAFPFMLFVAGPRIAAGGPLAWRPWILRFVFFYLSSRAGLYRMSA